MGPALTPRGRGGRRRMRMYCLWMAAAMLAGVVTAVACSAQDDVSSLVVSEQTRVSLNLVFMAITVALSAGAAGTVIKLQAKEIALLRDALAVVQNRQLTMREDLVRHLGDESKHTEAANLVTHLDCAALHQRMLHEFEKMRRELLEQTRAEVRAAVAEGLARKA